MSIPQSSPKPSGVSFGVTLDPETGEYAIVQIQTYGKQIRHFKVVRDGLTRYDIKLHLDRATKEFWHEFEPSKLG